MNVKDILRMTPESLAKEQHTALKNAVIKRLNEVVALIEEDEYEKVSHLLEQSPSGDGHGCDNSYIDFSDIYGEDIEDVVDKLNRLANISK